MPGTLFLKKGQAILYTFLNMEKYASHGVTKGSFSICWVTMMHTARGTFLGVGNLLFPCEGVLAEVFLSYCQFKHRTDT
jgi:hypothetical protein